MSNTLPQQPDRITDLNATIIDIVTSLVDGDPGAMRVLAQMLQDPMDVFNVLLFDTYNIYGSDIWIAYKDYAGQDIDKLTHALKNQDERDKMIKVILDSKGN